MGEELNFWKSCSMGWCSFKGLFSISILFAAVKKAWVVEGKQVFVDIVFPKKFLTLGDG